MELKTESCHHHNYQSWDQESGEIQPGQRSHVGTRLAAMRQGPRPPTLWDRTMGKNLRTSVFFYFYEHIFIKTFSFKCVMYFFATVTPHSLQLLSFLPPDSLVSLCFDVVCVGPINERKHTICVFLTPTYSPHLI